MRTPDYASHSSLKAWERDRKEFFLKYLADTRAPRTPQTEAMVAGSAFDAYVKSSLCSNLGISIPEMELDTLFEAQVEPHLRDFGRKCGPYILYWYRKCGAYAELLELLEQSEREPRFESTVKGVVKGVPMLGKPDLDFVINGAEVVWDWKVRGYQSKSTVSPTQGYRIVRDAHAGKPSKTNGQSHKKFDPHICNGLEINKNPLEAVNETYAEQLTMYGWLLGADDPIVCISEIVCKPMPEAPPRLRVADLRAKVTPAFRDGLMWRYRRMWAAILTEQIFEEDNDEQCQIVNDAAAALASEDDDFYSSIVRNTDYRG